MKVIPEPKFGLGMKVKLRPDYKGNFSLAPAGQVFIVQDRLHTKAWGWLYVLGWQDSDRKCSASWFGDEDLEAAEG